MNYKLLLSALAVGGLSLLGQPESPKAYGAHPPKATIAKLAGFVPIEIVIVDGNVACNQMVEYKVTLSGTPDEDQVIEIGTTDLSAYDHLPTHVKVPAGSDSVCFSAKMSSQLPLFWAVGASCNGGMAMAVDMVQPPSVKVRP